MSDAIVGSIRLFLSNIQVQQSYVAGFGQVLIFCRFDRQKQLWFIAILALVDGLACDGAAIL